MAFMSYDEKLRREYHRRDAGLLQIKRGADQLSHAVSDKVSETRAALTARISQAQAAVTGKIDDARAAVAERVGEARETIALKFESLRQAVNPAARIRQHPFAWFFGALVAGIAAAPALKALVRHNGAAREEERVPAGAAPSQTAAYLLPVINAFLPLGVQYLRQRLNLSESALQEQTRPEPVPASISRRMRNMPQS